MKNKTTRFSLFYKVLLRLGGGAALLLIALFLLSSCDSGPVKDYETQGSTYLVYTETGLRVWADAAKSDPSLSCTLHANITLTSSNESESNWSPIGSSSAPYTGTFDGNDHKITGLKIILVTDSSPNYIGFFGYVGSSGTVKNLNLENVNIQIDNGNLPNVCYSGAIAGYSEGSIDSCIVSGNVSNSKSQAPLKAGGIVGYVYRGSILNCINRCEISSTAGMHPGFGGIAGDVTGCTISGCENYGSINLVGVGAVEGGGIAGSVSNTTVTSCYNRGNIFVKNNGITTSGDTLSLGSIVGSADSSSITNCKIEGCTLEYYALPFYYGDNPNFVGDFVGNMQTVDQSNTGSATIVMHPIPTTSST